MTDYNIFELGDVDLQCGLRLRGARLAYQTYGELNSSRDNVIVFPTFFSSRHEANEPMIGEGMALDPSRYFIMSCPTSSETAFRRRPATPRNPTTGPGSPPLPTTTTSAFSIAWLRSSLASRR